MKNNVIPRTSQKMLVKMKIPTSAGGVGETLNAWKDFNGWHGKNENGETFFLFLSMLRNAEICDIKIIA